MKIKFVKDIIEDIINVATAAKNAGRIINYIELTKEEAEELDFLLIERGIALPDDRLVSDGGDVEVAGISIFLEKESYMH